MFYLKDVIVDVPRMTFRIHDEGYLFRPFKVAKKESLNGKTYFILYKDSLDRTLFLSCIFNPSLVDNSKEDIIKSIESELDITILTISKSLIVHKNIDGLNSYLLDEHWIKPDLISGYISDDEISLLPVNITIIDFLYKKGVCLKFDKKDAARILASVNSNGSVDVLYIKFGNLKIVTHQFLLELVNSLILLGISKRVIISDLPFKDNVLLQNSLNQ